MARALGRVGHALRHHTSFGPDRGQRLGMAGHLHELHLGHGFELFGVDHRAFPGQRDRAAGVAGAAAARHDGQAQLETAAHQLGHLGLGVGGEHHERVFHAPVGRVGHVRHAREAIKLDVVVGGELAQRLGGALAQRGHVFKRTGKRIDRAACSGEQLAHQGVAGLVVLRRAALGHLAQAVMQSIHQLLSALGRVQQIVLQIRVALHHPNIAQHLVQHAGRAPGAALAAQLIEQGPGALAEQPHHNFTIRKRRVVVGDFAQTRRVVGGVFEERKRGGSVHGK